MIQRKRKKKVKKNKNRIPFSFPFWTLSWFQPACSGRLKRHYNDVPAPQYNYYCIFFLFCFVSEFALIIWDQYPPHHALVSSLILQIFLNRVSNPTQKIQHGPLARCYLATSRNVAILFIPYFIMTVLWNGEWTLAVLLRFLCTVGPQLNVHSIRLRLHSLLFMGKRRRKQSQSSSFGTLKEIRYQLTVIETELKKLL